MAHAMHDQALKAQLERLVTEIALRSPLARSAPRKGGRYLLNTDAGVRNGEGAIGVVLSDPDDHLIAHHSRKIGPASIQEAEYKALLRGLELARRRRVPRLHVYLDNQLVVDQINGVARVKNANLRGLRSEAVALLDRFPDQRRNPHHRVCWVPRERNRLADALATSALD